MIFRRVFIAIGCVLFSPLSQANSSLGEVNIELRGNVVDFTCAVVAGDSNKSVNLGTWPTKQLHAAGDATQPVAFSLKLEGCPPGSASITFSGTRQRPARHYWRLPIRQWRKNWRLKFAMAINVDCHLNRPARPSILTTTAMLP